MDKTASLTPVVRRIVCDKATEYPNSGDYNLVAKAGTYLCRRCGLALFRAASKFHSGCGWPAFDSSIENAVIQRMDKDRRRTEILCQRCDAHLGHVFTGEGLTPANLRHCVNSAAMDFVEDTEVLDTEEAIVAGGCFWGVEYFLRKLPGVVKVESGYTGGSTVDPSYEQICSGTTGHYEAVRVVFDNEKTDYAAVIQCFFEIHDPVQTSGQGPDIGQQYKSAIFCYNDSQITVVKYLIQKLQEYGYHAATRVLPVFIFWAAENYHQEYYLKHNKLPYCHVPVERFNKPA